MPRYRHIDPDVVDAPQDHPLAAVCPQCGNGEKLIECAEGVVVETPIRVTEFDADERAVYDCLIVGYPAPGDYDRHVELWYRCDGCGKDDMQASDLLTPDEWAASGSYTLATPSGNIIAMVSHATA